MKKSLLFLLPALMALSACGTNTHDVETKNNDPFEGVVEDTLAHEEIFGNAEAALKLEQEKKAPVFLSTVEPVIGVQTQIDKDDASKMHMRFVAAVKIDGDLASATAVWTRAIFYDSTGGGDASKAHKDYKAAAPKTSNKAYTTLNNGGAEYSISTFDSTHDSLGYNYFVVYTVLNIPITNANYYITSYVTVTDSVGTSRSKVLATTVDQKTQFTYDYERNNTGYFGIKKSTTGTFSSFTRDNYALNGNKARFVNVSLNKDESFILVNSAADYFDVYGYDMTHAADGEDATFTYDNANASLRSKFAVAKATGSHYFYLSNGGETQNYIYRTDATKTKTYWLQPNNGWKQASAWFALYTSEYVNAVNQQKWYGMSGDGYGNYLCDITYENLDNVLLIFCRMNPASGELSFNNKWTQTYDLNDSDAHTKNWYTINSGDDYNERNGSWKTI